MMLFLCEKENHSVWGESVLPHSKKENAATKNFSMNFKIGTEDKQEPYDVKLHCFSNIFVNYQLCYNYDNKNTLA